MGINSSFVGKKKPKAQANKTDNDFMITYFTIIRVNIIFIKFSIRVSNINITVTWKIEVGVLNKVFGLPATIHCWLSSLKIRSIGFLKLTRDRKNK